MSRRGREGKGKERMGGKKRGGETPEQKILATAL